MILSKYDTSTFKKLFQYLLIVSIIIACLALIIIPNVASKGSSTSPAWGTPIPIFQSDPAYPGPLSIIQDNFGNIHALWIIHYGCTYGCEVMYAIRDVSGVWSDPEFIPMIFPPKTYIDPYSPPVMLVDSEGTSHVIWTANGYTGYTSKPSGGAWTSPIKLDFVDNDNGVIAHLGSDDSIHVMGKCTNTYLSRSPSGEWSSETITYCPMDFDIDTVGTIHVLTRAYNNVFNLYYIKRLPGESWSSPELISSGDYDLDRAKIALSPSGNVHATWTERTSYDCFPLTCTGFSLYHQALELEVWSSTLYIDLLTMGNGSYYATNFDIEVADDGTAYIMWQKKWEDLSGDPTRVSVVARNADGALGERNHRDGLAGFIVVGWNNDVHVTWRDGCLKHQWYLPSDGWSEINNAGCLEGELYRITPGNENVPGSINSLFLVYMDRGQVYNFELIYNSFELANTPTPTPTTTASPTSTKTPTPTITPTVTPTATITPQSTSEICLEECLIFIPMLLKN